MRKVLIIILIIVTLIGLGFASYYFIIPNLNSENRSINSWIKENNLNKYGDALGTVYSSGKPCDNTLSCFNYIKKIHPDQPWLK